MVRGKAPRPVYLWISDGKAELHSAESLWGMALSKLMAEIEKRHGPQARVLGIGPAGENLCRQAPAIVDLEHATGISGTGAVMGSKMLKAIAVRGTGPVAVAKPRELMDLWFHCFRLLNRKPGDEEYPNVVKSLTYYMYHPPHIPHCPGRPSPPTDPAVNFKNRGLDDPISLVREPVNQGVMKLKLRRTASPAPPAGMPSAQPGRGAQPRDTTRVDRKPPHPPRGRTAADRPPCRIGLSTY